MSKKHISDSSLFQLYKTEPKLALQLSYEKFINSRSKVLNKYLLLSRQVSKYDREYVEENIKESIETALIKGKGSIKAGVDEYLNKEIQTMVRREYEIDSGGLDFDYYEEYFDVLLMSGTEIEEYEKRQFIFYGAPPILDREQQIFYSLDNLERIYVDNMSNEACYSAEQIMVIESAIDDIDQLLYERNLELAQDKLVALQVLMGIKVDFVSSLKKIYERRNSLYNLIDVDLYRSKRLDNGEGRVYKR